MKTSVTCSPKLLVLVSTCGIEKAENFLFLSIPLIRLKIRHNILQTFNKGREKNKSHTLA